jgi:hypothetical protein
MIIGLCGYKGTGKDTVGRYLVARYGYEQLAFADKLKKSVAALFGIPRSWVDDFKYNVPLRVVAVEPKSTDRQLNLEWRTFLQRYGTEAHRDVFGNDFWVEQLEKSLPPDFITTRYVVTDVRFENEAAWIHQKLGLVVAIKRPGFKSDGHASEILPIYNYAIENDGTIEDLYTKVDEFMERYVL